MAAFSLESLVKGCYTRKEYSLVNIVFCIQEKGQIMSRKKIYTALGICGVMAMLAGCENKEQSASVSDSSAHAASSTVSASSNIDSGEETGSDQGQEERFGLPVADDLSGQVDILDCVTLGAYKGLTLEKEEKQVTEEEIDRAIQNALDNTQIITGGAEAGDRVFVSYQVKTEDGAEVAEASSEGIQLTLGESGLPEEFDEGLKGMQAGEQKDIEVTFPDSYEKVPQLKGNTAVYQVTMNSITRSYPELTQEWLQENTQYSSEEEYREAVRENLEQELQLDEESAYEENAWQQILQGCRFSQYLKSEIESAETQYEVNMSNYLNIEGIDMDTYLARAGISKEEYEAQREEELQKEVEKSMAIQAIAETEGFSAGDAEFEQELEKMAAEAQMTTDAVKTMYGEQDLEKQVNARRVADLIMSTAKK